MLIVIIILIGISTLVGLIYMYLPIILVKHRVIKIRDIQSNSLSARGICYFDIDGTLTSSIGNPDEIVQECLDNNFDIGIITASNRKLEDMCSNGKSLYPWMSDILCKRLAQNKKLYNSSAEVGGNNDLPSDYKSLSNFGHKKAYDMMHGKKINNYDIKDKCIVLFDDQPAILNSVKEYNPNLETQCANSICNGDYLSKELVRKKLHEMKSNGC